MQTATASPSAPPIIDGLPPGSRLPRPIQTLLYVTRTREQLIGLRARYGDTYTIRALNGVVVIGCTPAHAKAVFAASPDLFLPFATGALDGLTGKGSLLVLHGAAHSRGRKLLVPPFHGPRLRAFGAAMRDVAREHVDRWKVGSEVRVHDTSLAISLEVILRTVFGADDAASIEEGRRAVQGALDSFSPMLVFSRRTQHRLVPAWRAFTRARDRFDAFVSACVARRRAASDRGDDVLSMLLDARAEDGTPLRDDEIRDHLLTVLVAGHETTAISLAWAVDHLLGRPDALERLRSELAANADAEPDAIAKLPWLSAVWDETLRIEPVVTDVVRELRAPFEYGGFRIPAGACVGVAIDVIHRDPSIYPEPLAFRPERFLERRFNAFEFLPFGGGHRRCIGAAFADYEGKLALAEIVSRVDLERVGPAERRVRRNVTMAPEHGTRVRVVRRR